MYIHKAIKYYYKDDNTHKQLSPDFSSEEECKEWLKYISYCISTMDKELPNHTRKESTVYTVYADGACKKKISTSIFPSAIMAPIC